MIPAGLRAVSFPLQPRRGDDSVSDVQQAPVIWRCVSCGALVHPPDEHAPGAWCPRCRRFTEATRDGG